MSLAGPFTYLDFDATPTQAADGEGGSFPVYPPRAGLFYITDPASFAAYAEALTPYRVEVLPAQAVLAGDDPENPTATVTLRFDDAQAAAAVVDPINALPPIPAPPPAAEPQPAAERWVKRYRFLVALSGFPALGGDPTRTLRDDWADALAAAPQATRDRSGAPDYRRGDPMLNAQFNAAAGSDLMGQALLDAVFDAADLVP